MNSGTVAESEQTGGAVRLDIFGKAYDYRIPGQAAAAGLYPYFIPVSSGAGPEVTMAGRRVLMFGSNNYLGLTAHLAVKRAASAAAALAALRIVQAEPERRDLLRRSVVALRDGIRSAGFRTGDAEAAIVPIEVGSGADALRLWRLVFDEGCYTNPAIPPAVDPGRSLLRASCMADHAGEHIRQAIEMFHQVAGAFPDAL